MSPPAGGTWRRLAAAAGALVLLTAVAAADEVEPAAVESAAPELPADVTTSHELALESSTLAYTVRAGVLPVRPEPQQPEAEIFYVAYTRDATEPARRPLTFLFNGGPGAASVFLHLGGIGPRRLAVNPDGTWPPAPIGLVDNPLTWLAFTDLVFVDPVGTGYSRVPEAAEGDKDDDKRRPSEFWAVERDLDSLGEFIRLYLTRNQRWLSPKVVAGESYGGFRVAALAKSLPEDFDIAPAGAILISPLLDYAMLGGNRYNLLPWALTLPSLAASAAWHERGSLAATAVNQELGATLAPVEAFALSDMLVGLAGGDPEGAYAAIAAFTGLSKELVTRRRGRIGAGVFAKQLLRDQERLVGRYDGTISGPDPHPEEADFTSGDPSFAFLTTAYAPALVAYLESELDYSTDAPYELLNFDVNRRWDFSDALPERRQGFVGFTSALREGVILNRGLNVLITHGYHDLITPYLASRYLVGQMDLPDEATARVQLANFVGGHMFYLRQSSLEALHKTAAAFFAALPH